MPDELNNATENAEQPKAAKKSRFWLIFAYCGIGICALAGIYIFDIIPDGTVNEDSARYALSAIAQSVAALGALTFTAIFIALQLFQDRYRTSMAPLLIRDHQLHMTVLCILLGILGPIGIIPFIGDAAFPWWLVAAGLVAGVAAMGATVWYVLWRIKRVNAKSILEECGQQIDALAVRAQRAKHTEMPKGAIGDLLYIIEELGNGAINANRPQLLGDVFEWLRKRYEPLFVANTDYSLMAPVRERLWATEKNLFDNVTPRCAEFRDIVNKHLRDSAAISCAKADDENWNRVINWLVKFVQQHEQKDDLVRTISVLGDVLNDFGKHIKEILGNEVTPGITGKPVLNGLSFENAITAIRTVGSELVNRGYYDELNRWIPIMFYRLLSLGSQRLQRNSAAGNSGHKQSYCATPPNYAYLQECMLRHLGGTIYVIAIEMQEMQDKHATTKPMVSYLDKVAGQIIGVWWGAGIIQADTFLEEVLFFFLCDSGAFRTEFPDAPTNCCTWYNTNLYSDLPYQYCKFAVHWHLMLWSYLQLAHPSKFNACKICDSTKAANMAQVCQKEFDEIPDEMWQAIGETAVYEKKAAADGQAAKQAALNVVERYKAFADERRQKTSNGNPEETT